MADVVSKFFEEAKNHKSPVYFRHTWGYLSFPVTNYNIKPIGEPYLYKHKKEEELEGEHPICNAEKLSMIRNEVVQERQALIVEIDRKLPYVPFFTRSDSLFDDEWRVKEYEKEVCVGSWWRPEELCLQKNLQWLYRVDGEKYKKAKDEINKL